MEAGPNPDTGAKAVGDVAAASLALTGTKLSTKVGIHIAFFRFQKSLDRFWPPISHYLMTGETAPKH
jgi:hypothetical protein